MKILRNSITTLGLPLLLLLSIVALVNSPFYASNPTDLSLGVTLDLLVTIPIVYFLLIREKEVPKITVASVFIVCLIAASFILPIEGQTLLRQIKFWAIPTVELFVFGFLLVKTQKTIKLFRDQKNSTPDFYSALSIVSREVFPSKLGTLLAFELSVVYYSLFAWKKRDTVEGEYTYYKKNGLIAVLYVVIFLILIETFALHLALERWNVVAAWVLTILSLYACVQFFALIRSVPRRPVFIDRNARKIFLCYGFFSETVIDINEIKSILKCRRSLPADKSIIQFSPLGLLDTHNIVLHLEGEHTLHGMYGIKKKYKSIAIHIDDKDHFIEVLSELKK